MPSPFRTLPRTGCSGSAMPHRLAADHTRPHNRCGGETPGLEPLAQDGQEAWERLALMKEKGAYISTNLTAFDPGLLTIPAIANVPSSLAKAKSASATFGGYIDNMKKCPVPRGFQTDCVGSVEACSIQIAYEKNLNNQFFGPHTSLVTLTSTGGEMVALSGDFMNPYPEGKLGVIEEGAYADILIVDGNPLEDFSVVGTGDKWFDAEPRPESPETIRIIMKDGKIYKNTL